MRAKASLTVILLFKSTNSIVIKLPAEFSGYIRIVLIISRVSLSVFLSTRSTTLAGISSIKSIASSIYNSLIILAISLSEKLSTSICCFSGERYAKISAAVSFGISLNRTTACSLFSTSSNSAAISAIFAFKNISLICENFFSSMSVIISIILFVLRLKRTNKHKPFSSAILT